SEAGLLSIDWPLSGPPAVPVRPDIPAPLANVSVGRAPTLGREPDAQPAASPRSIPDQPCASAPARQETPLFLRRSPSIGCRVSLFFDPVAIQHPGRAGARISGMRGAAVDIANTEARHPASHIHLHEGDPRS